MSREHSIFLLFFFFGSQVLEYVFGRTLQENFAQGDKSDVLFNFGSHSPRILVPFRTCFGNCFKPTFSLNQLCLEFRVQLNSKSTFLTILARAIFRSRNSSWMRLLTAWAAPPRTWPRLWSTGCFRGRSPSPRTVTSASCSRGDT